MQGQTSYLQHQGNKMHFISLGCPRNLVDTEVMLGLLLKAGYEVTPNLPDADYVIINTCGFLEASRQESLGTVKEAMEMRKKRARVIVTGCMVQTHRLEIKKHFPQVDYFLGSGDIENILQAVKDPSSGSHVTDARSYLEAGEVPRKISTPHHFAYLKIAEGCRKQCAYCIIPTIKGPLKSKSVDQILHEFRALRAQGVREIILIAQDLGDWGKDQGYKRSEGLVHLLKEILKEKGAFWLRLLYLYPDEITLSLIQLMQSDSRICPYLDMPIQHVNNKMLKAMHRATSREQIIQTINRLRMEIPDISIRTSLIVGFPGETRKQFQELIDFLQQHPIDQVGIFRYSKEPGSIAASLPNQVPENIKVQRYHRLVKVQQKIVRSLLQKKIGQTLEVVVEGYSSESNLLMVGRYKGQCPDIDGCVIINDSTGIHAFGKCYPIQITDFSGYDLIGKVAQGQFCD